MTSATPLDVSLDCAVAYTLQFVRTALPSSFRRVLEIGCGEGALAVALAAQGLAVTAIDSEPACVEVARRRGVGAHVAEWPEFAAAGFDAILFTRSLHHMRDLRGSVAAAARALNPNGVLIVEDFMGEGAPQGSQAWFASLVFLLEAIELVSASPHLLEALGYAEPAHHDGELHGSVAIELALRDELTTVNVQPSAYFFRYLLPQVGEKIGAALLAHERDLIDAQLIEPYGRRYVASKV